MNKLELRITESARRKRITLAALLFCAAIPLCAQDALLQSYQSDFSKADLAAKAGILKSAAADRRAGGFIGSLCEFALRFALQNAEILNGDPDMLNLISIAARGMESSGYRDGVDTLWQVFSQYRNSQVRVEILGALGMAGKGNPVLVENLNRFLADTNALYASLLIADYPVVSACIAALADLGDESSFAPLFSVLTAGYPEVISLEASGALDMISGNYRQFLLNIILKGEPAEKLAAFRAGMNSGRFSPAERGQLAETALDQSLLETSLLSASSRPEDNAALAALRYASALALTSLKWTRAGPLAVRHFYRTQTEFQQGTAPKERFLEAIACLGAMESSDAALALALQLGLINAQTEKTGVYDEDITLAAVQALGAIGDKAAFDYLLYISYLPYPEHIQAAAKEALNRLKW